MTVDQAAAISSAGSTTFVAGKAGSFLVTTTGFPAPSLSVLGSLPGGVGFTDNGDGTAALAGTPAAGSGGVYSFTVTAHNGVGADATETFTLTVDEAPAITSANHAHFNVGVASFFDVFAVVFPAPALAEAGALPTGVTFTDHGNGTATLAGTPAAGSGGSYPLTITASNGILPDASQSFTLTIGQPAAITSASGATFTVGSAGSFTVTTTGNPIPNLGESGGLPTGVGFVDNGNGTATLSGTPAAGTGGLYSLVVTAHNGVGVDAVQAFTLTVDQAPAITSAGATTFTVGSAGSFLVTATGFPVPSLVETGPLPAGVSFVDHGNGTATLAGAPVGGTGGTWPVMFTADPTSLPDAIQSFTLTVDDPAAITSPAATTFTVGSPGTFLVTSTGFPLPSLAETGTLPNGISFVDNSNGTATLAGTPAPNTGGIYQLTITGHNGVGSDAVRPLAFTVDQAPAISSARSVTFTAGRPGSFTITSTGFPAPSLAASGTLPGGVTFADQHNGSAILSGTPVAGSGGVYPVSFTAHNGVGSDAVQPFTFSVAQAPTITSARSVTFTVGTAGSFTVTATGFPVPSLSRSGTLPAGVTFADQGNGTALLSGTPAAHTGGPYPLTLTAHNAVGSDAVQLFTLTVAEPPAITSPASAVLRVNRPGSVLITTTGYPRPALSETGVLPAGLSFVDHGDGTATIGGTADKKTAGTYALVITAHNGVGADAGQSFTLLVTNGNNLNSV